ncbi:hypothetical protein ACHAXR_009545 [Thalassiosira sp. AJA248-18]
MEMAPSQDEVVAAPPPPPPPEVYPLSRKKVMLIEQSKKLNAPKGSYSSIGWSNRHGSVLTPASIPGVYTADRPFYWNKIDVGCRMTVIQLQSSSSSSNNENSNGDDDDDGSSSTSTPELVVHSPVGLDPPLIDALQTLGTVTHVISPNYEHVKYAKQWGEQYPNAKMWGCPGLMEREPEVRWTGEVPYGARPPGFFAVAPKNENSNAAADATGEVPYGAGPSEFFAAAAAVGNTGKNEKIWDREELQPLHIDTEANPFTGKAFFNEVVYYHAPSKTLLTTDLYWNYPRGDGVTNGQVVDELAAKGITVGAGVDEDDDGDFGVWELAPNVGDIPLGSRIWGKVGMDKLFYPFYMNLMVKNDKREKFHEIARFVTCGGGGDNNNGSNSGGAWEVETIIPAHGDIVRGRELCRKVLETHFNIQCS